jgi:hypothetical protein
MTGKSGTRTPAPPPPLRRGDADGTRIEGRETRTRSTPPPAGQPGAADDAGRAWQVVRAALPEAAAGSTVQNAPAVLAGLAHAETSAPEANGMPASLPRATGSESTETEARAAPRPCLPRGAAPGRGIAGARQRP